MRPISAFCLAIGGLLLAEVSMARDSVTWEIDETIRRSDDELFWTSPTSIDLGFDQYTYDYEITQITALVLVEIDYTNEFGQSFPLTQMGQVDSLPIVLIDDVLSDATTGTTANVLIEVDSNGSGQAAFTNISLGRAGFFNIQSIRIEATVTLTGINFTPGDYNRDGLVDAADYDLWAADYGTTDRPAADGNEDGLIDAADYTIWRDNVPAAGVSIPEPATALIAGIALMLAAGCRRE